MPVTDQTQDGRSGHLRSRFGELRFRRVMGALLFLFGLGLIAGVILHRSLISTYAPVYLESLAEDFKTHYDLEFTWQGYLITGLDDFTISGVSIRDIPKNSQLLHIDSIRIRTNLFSVMIKQWDPSLGITSVQINNPVLTLGRSKDGSWNTGRFLEPGKGEPIKYPGKLGLIIKSGAIEWVGGEVVDGFPFPASSITGLTGDFRLEANGGMGLNFEGKFFGTDVDPSGFTMIGAYDNETQKTTMRMGMDSLDLALLLPVFKNGQLDELDGVANVETSFIIGDSVGSMGFSMIGAASIDDGSFRSDKYGLSGQYLSGVVHFSPDSIFTSSVRGEVNGSKIHIFGEASGMSSGKPFANFVVEGTDVPAAIIAERLPSVSYLKPGGVFNTRTEVNYSPENGLDAIFTADSPSVTLKGIPLNVRNLYGWYHDDVTVINTLDVVTLGGNITADGQIDTSGPKPGYKFAVSCKNFNSIPLEGYLEDVTDIQELPKGTISVDLNIATGDDFKPTASGVFSIPDASFTSPVRIADVDITIPFEYAGDEIKLTGTSAVGTGSVLLMDGKYSIKRKEYKGSMALAIEEPSQLERLSGLPIQGTLSVSGDFGYHPGGLRSFTYDGEAIIHKIKLGPLTGQDIAANVSVNDGYLLASNLSGHINEGELEGEILVPLERVFDDDTENAPGIIHLSGLNVADMMPPWLSQTINTSLDINGSVQFLKNGEILKTELIVYENGAQVGPNILDSGESGIIVRASLPLENIEATSIEVSGIINSKPASDEIYHGRALTNFSSEALHNLELLMHSTDTVDSGPEQAWIPRVTGAFHVDTSVGKIADLSDGSIAVSSENLKVAGLVFPVVSLTMNSGNGRLWDVKLSADTGETGQIELVGTISRADDVPKSTLDIGISLSNAGLRGVLELAGFTDLAYTTGLLNGSGRIQGYISDPSVSTFKIEIGESTAFGIPIYQGTADFSFKSPILNVRNLEVNGHEGFKALGSGMLNLADVSFLDANLEFRLDSLDLSTISRIAGRPFPLSGKASGSLLLTRDALGPKILYDARVVGLEIREEKYYVPFGDLDISAEYYPGDEQIRIEKMELHRDLEKITLSGMVPSNLHNAGAETIDLKLESAEGYAFSVVYEDVEPLYSWNGGLGQCDLTMTGSYADPEINGEVSLVANDLSIGPWLLASQIGGRIKIEDSIAEISPEDFKISRDEWALGVQGQARLRQLKYFLETMRLELPASVFIGEFKIVPLTGTSVIAKGPGFDLNIRPGQDDRVPKLTLKGKSGQLSALIDGDISILGGEVNLGKLPPFPEPGERALQLSPVNFNLNSEIEAGVRVQFGDMMNVTCESGSLQLLGNLSNPIVSGHLYAPTGWIEVIGNNFALSSQLDVQFSSIYPPTDPHISGTAVKTFQEVRSPSFYGEQLVVTARVDSNLSSMMDNMIENHGLTSEPPLNQDQIIQALAYEDVVFRTIGNTLFGGNTMDPGFDEIDVSIVLPFATSYLAKYIREEVGLTNFELTMDSDQNVLVYVEKEVFNNVVVFYSQKFGSSAEDNYYWGARYRWRPRSWVGFEMNNDEDITGQVEYLIPF